MAVGNSGDVIISQTSFYGGMGTDGKIGIKNSFGDSECMDARKSPSALTVLPGARRMADDDLDGLIVAMEQAPDGMRYGIDTNGVLYKIDLSDDITKFATMPDWEDGSIGDLVYWESKDQIYVTGGGNIYLVTGVTDGGTVQAKKITGQHSTYPTMAQILVKDRDGKWTGGGTERWGFKNGSSGKWGIPKPGDIWYKGGSAYENENNRCRFLPDQSPLIAIDVKISRNAGSGNLTIEIHDETDKVVASSTMPASSIGADGKIRFNFPKTKLQDYRNYGTEYHLHLYSDTAGFEAETYEDHILQGLHFWYYAALLFDTYKKSYPIINWGGTKILIGNGKYLVEWQPSGLDKITGDEIGRHRILVENGMEITSLTSNDEYVVMGCERVGKSNARTFQQGTLAFWDGFASSWNFKIDTPMGEPKSLYTYQNITYMIIDGAIYCYTGSKALTKIRTIQDSQSEFTNTTDATDVFSHCMTIRRGILLLAYPSTTSLLSMRHGIYSYGSVDKDYPNSFYYSYSVPDESNYNTEDREITLGGVWNYGDTMYFSYRVYDKRTGTTTSNMAIVDNTSLPARNFQYSSLKYDGGMPWKSKEALRMVVSFDPLPEGCTIQARYKIDNRQWVYNTRIAKSGETEVYFEINKRFREIQFGFVGTNSGDKREVVRITSVGLNVRELSEEGKMHK